MAQTSSGKRERGANYTAEEKTVFAGLIAQYKHIVEDKRTGGIFIRRKKEAWKAITDKYNSKCCTGRRGMAQLKALYDNMKQKARKTIGESNVEMNKTGDGCNEPKPTDSDSKIMAIIYDKVDPLDNPFDSGALDFKDAINLLEPTHSKPRSPEIAIGFSDDIKIIENQFSESVEQSDSGNSIDLEINRDEDSPTVTHEADVTDVRKCETNLVKRRLLNTTNAKKQKGPGILQKPLRNASAEELKRVYLKKKCQNANLERKKLIQEILQNKEQHRLKMLILKKKMENIS